MIKAFFIDFDGTIVDSERVHLDAWNDVLAKYSPNTKISVQDYNNKIFAKGEPNAIEVVKSYLPDNIKEHINDIAKKKQQRYKEKIRKGDVTVKGVYDFIDFLKQNEIKPIVVSSAHRDILDKLLKVVKLSELERVGGDEVTYKKPDPELYELAAKRYNLNKDEIIVIEDSDSGVLGAKEFGAKDVFGVRTTYSEKQFLQMGVKNSFDDFNQILNYTKKLLKK